MISVVSHYAERRYAERRYAERRYAERRYAERRYAERCYAECRGAEANVVPLCGATPQLPDKQAWSFFIF